MRVTVKCHLRLLHTLLLLRQRVILILNSAALPATYWAIIPNVHRVQCPLLDAFAVHTPEIFVFFLLLLQLHVYVV